MSTAGEAVMQRTNPADAEAIEASIALAAERGGDLTPRVYARLFAKRRRWALFGAPQRSIAANAARCSSPVDFMASAATPP